MCAADPRCPTSLPVAAHASAPLGKQGSAERGTQLLLLGDTMLLVARASPARARHSDDDADRNTLRVSDF